MTGEERGVIDGIVNDLAVVLVGDAEDEHHVSVAELPQGAGGGRWLRARRAEGGLIIVGIDAAGEQRQHDQLDQRIASADSAAAADSDGETEATGVSVVRSRSGGSVRPDPADLVGSDRDVDQALREHGDGP